MPIGRRVEPFIAAMSGSVLLALLASLLMPEVRGRVINICSKAVAFTS